MNPMPITKEVIDELEARKIIRQEFLTLLKNYECFYHARHFVRANAMLSDLNFYAKILELKLSSVLGRNDLDSFFLETDSDSLLMRIQNRIKSVSKPFQTESQTASNPHQGSESVSKSVSNSFQTVSIEVQKVDLEKVEQVFDKNSTISVLPKPFQKPFQTASKSELETVSKPHQIRFKTETESLPNHIKTVSNPHQIIETVSKHDVITCPNCQKEIKNRRSNQFYCDKTCKTQYNNKQRKAA